MSIIILKKITVSGLEKVKNLKEKNNITRFISFCVSGTLGFLIDSVTYYLLSTLFAFYIARVISFFVAVIFTWLFNRNITFNDKKFHGSVAKEFMYYFSSMAIGGAANYLSFIGLMEYVEIVKDYPVIGIAVGSVVGLAINFTLSKLVVYRTQR